LDSRVLVIDRVATPWFVFAVGGAGTGQNRTKDLFAEDDQRGERTDRWVGYLIAAGAGHALDQVFGAQLAQVVGGPGGGVLLAGDPGDLLSPTEKRESRLAGSPDANWRSEPRGSAGD